MQLLIFVNHNSFCERTRLYEIDLINNTNSLIDLNLILTF